MNAGQIFLAIAFVLACGYLVFGYPHRYGTLTGRSRLFRTVWLALLILFLGLVLLGTFLDFGYDAPRRVAVLREIVYWLACVFLALALVCIAILDWLEALVFYRREQRNLIQQMAREEQERVHGLQEEHPPRDEGDPPPTGSPPPGKAP